MPALELPLPKQLAFGISRPADALLPGGTVNAVSNLINYLDEVDHYPALYLNNDVLRNAVRRYEKIWIPLLTDIPVHRRNTLAPPLDIQWVWMCHMLCPTKYNQDTAAILRKLSPQEDDEILDHRLRSISERDKAWARTIPVWSQHFPNEPFHLTEEIRSAPLVDLDENIDHPTHFPDPSSLITYDIVAASKRQMVFHYQVAVMPQYRNSRFLREAVSRYFFGFLHLQREFARQIWVPTYDIDLVWHAHLMHPVLYKSYTNRIRGSLLPHDDTLNDRTPGSHANDRWLATLKTWRSRFNSNIYRPGAMWRGYVSSYERMLRQDIISQSAELAKQFQLHLGSTYNVWEQNNWVLNEQEERAWRKIEWVHTTEWRRIAENKDCGNVTEASSHLQRFLCIGVNQAQRPLVAASVSYMMRKSCCAKKVDEYITAIELCSGSEKVEGLRYPLATAHDVMINSMLDKTASWQLAGCRKLPGEKVLVLRMCGQDIALLGGRWIGCKKETKLTRSWSRNHGSLYGVGDDSRGRGRLSLRIWSLHGKHSTWQTLEDTKCAEDNESNSPGMMYRCRITANPMNLSEKFAGQVEFDLKKGGIKVSHGSLGLLGCLLGVCAASLYVGLQPRYDPGADNESMYPGRGMRHSECIMLRGAGGEVIDEELRFGLSQMRYEKVKKHDKANASGFFAGGIVSTQQIK